MALYRVALELKGIDLFEPRVLVGCENAVWVAGLRQHLAAFQERVVFERVKGFASGGQSCAHQAVAPERLGLVVVVGKDGLHTQGVGQRGNGITGHRVQHDQTTLWMPRKRAQRFIEFNK